MAASSLWWTLKKQINKQQNKTKKHKATTTNFQSPACILSLKSTTYIFKNIFKKATCLNADVDFFFLLIDKTTAHAL